MFLKTGPMVTDDHTTEEAMFHIDRIRTEEIFFRLRRQRGKKGTGAMFSTHRVRNITDPFAFPIPPSGRGLLRGVVSREYIESAFAHLVAPNGFFPRAKTMLLTFFPKKRKEQMIDCVVCGREHERASHRDEGFYRRAGDFMKSRGWSVFIGCGEELFESAERDRILDGLLRAGISRKMSVWTFEKNGHREDFIGFHGFGFLLVIAVVFLELHQY